MTEISWGAKVTPEFLHKVISISFDLGWTEQQASFLMGCMAFESGETFSPSVKNAAGSGATGLIQFMPATALGLGVTVGRLSQMTAVQQLDFVKDYFRPYAKRVKTLSDMYMAILLPKYVGQPEDSVLFSGGISYRQNSGLDANKDGIITKKEASAMVQAKYEKGLKTGYVATV